ncbi:MAG: serine hydrolase [Candidatus Sphingomonas colombiensis]|nr:serine hydrolase domain-containing protein [Sphingomonas sp.]WEK42890.1 MAG: serine hydrolase [Sphingomonas sp.]
MKLAAVLALASLASAPAPNVSATRDIVTDPKGANAPGCAVGAFRDGKTLFTTAAGMADLEMRKPIDADTLFYAASVSKQFTALAAATLIERGKIGLDDDVRKYLPELPRYDAPITVRMLIHHTSGIRDSLTLMRFAGAAGANEMTKAQGLDLLFAQKGTNFTPGTSYTYSNGGYLLLAEIVERVSGMPFADYAAQAVMKPLGMKRAMFMNDRRPDLANFAHGYNPKGDGYAVRDTYPYFSGSGGLLISINDFAKYDYDLTVGHKVWTPAVQAIMLTPGAFTNGAPAIEQRSGLAYAGGLQMGMRGGQKIIQHGGAAEAFKTHYERFPDRKLSIVVLCNRGDWVSQDKADAVANIVDGHFLAAPRKPAPGRYVSDELKSSYDIVFDGDKLTAGISSTYKPQGEPLELTRGAGESWTGDGATLVFDADGRGFTVGTDRAEGLHFRKVN